MHLCNKRNPQPRKKLFDIFSAAPFQSSCRYIFLSEKGKKKNNLIFHNWGDSYILYAVHDRRIYIPIGNEDFEVVKRGFLTLHKCTLLGESFSCVHWVNPIHFIIFFLFYFLMQSIQWQLCHAILAFKSSNKWPFYE